MDKTAIQEINAQSALKALNVNLNEQHDIVVIPDGATPVDLVQFTDKRRWFTGKFNSSCLSSFIDYINNNKDTHLPLTHIYISTDSMTARAFFDIRHDDGSPGKCEHVATLGMRPTPEMSAIKDLCISDALNQRQLAEWLEEWGEIVTPFDKDNNDIDLKKAITAIRGMTIESLRKTDSEVGDMNQSRSTIDRIEAKGTAVTVAGFTAHHIMCYDEIATQDITVKLRIITTGETVAFKARMLRTQIIEQALRENLSDFIIKATAVSNTYLGEFRA
ncbi:MAG: YfdQ family protein [Candidatus Thiodiazotropha sp. (ex Epidulcina cf. delphinae)]|nr:YfdQ family protein [Candidatus Thiodiazotropha sp. (ex Epidulcina cf. delphinae)]